MAMQELYVGSLLEYSLKEPVITTPDFVLFLDRYEDDLYIHCDVIGGWNRLVKKKLRIALDVLLNMHKQPIYAVHDQGDNTHSKFLTMFGFKYYKSRTGLDGLERDIYINNSGVTDNG